MRRYVAAFLMAGSMTLPSTVALADFYVVHDSKMNQCMVTEQPAGARIVGPSGMIFKYRNEAEAALNMVNVCTRR